MSQPKKEKLDLIRVLCQLEIALAQDFELEQLKQEFKGDYVDFVSKVICKTKIVGALGHSFTQDVLKNCHSGENLHNPLIRSILNTKLKDITQQSKKRVQDLWNSLPESIQNNELSHLFISTLPAQQALLHSVAMQYLTPFSTVINYDKSTCQTDLLGNPDEANDNASTESKIDSETQTLHDQPSPMYKEKRLDDSSKVSNAYWIDFDFVYLCDGCQTSDHIESHSLRAVSEDGMCDMNLLADHLQRNGWKFDLVSKNWLCKKCHDVASD